MSKDKETSKYNGNELKYLKQALKTDTGIENPVHWNKKLEKMFAKKFGVKYAIAHNSGTSALHSCLSAAGVGPGDEVISPPITVLMNTLATLYQNAVPIYADVDPDTFNIDPKEIEKKITSRTKAIFTVSMYGLPPDMDPIMELAKKHNIVVIEDNAECYLTTYKGRLAGTIGDMSIFSFESSKHISTGAGGIAITNNKEYALKIRKCGGVGYRAIRADGNPVTTDKSFLQSPDYKRHDYLGWNYRLSEFSAAIATAQLEQLDEKVKKRKEIARYFEEAIKNCDWMIPQKVPEDCTNSYWSYVVRYEGEKEIGVSWKEFYKTYKEMGGDGFYGRSSVPYLEPLMTDRNFYGKGCPVECPHYKGPRIEYKKGLCPVAEGIQPKLMQFKTNYRDLDLAKRKTEALRKTIEKFI